MSSRQERKQQARAQRLEREAAHPGIGVEVKKTRDGFADREVGTRLAEDVTRYSDRGANRSHACLRPGASGSPISVNGPGEEEEPDLERDEGDYDRRHGDHLERVGVAP